MIVPTVTIPPEREFFAELRALGEDSYIISTGRTIMLPALTVAALVGSEHGFTWRTVPDSNGDCMEYFVWSGRSAEEAEEDILEAVYAWSAHRQQQHEQEYSNAYQSEGCHRAAA